ncbi:hypothetical protein niasHT_008944 [Heterodera trifolii]|uniref:PAZ domain-containing protein n=1 Tax=Heterodera trifolii TaxID=157864 RepID=A0ABD2M071_9BILA
MMDRLDTVIASLLNCSARNLCDRLNHPDEIQKVERFLKGKTLQTTYKNQLGEEKDFVFDGITKKIARRQLAYNGYKNVTVDQHFYVRHHICLRYANNPCVIEKHKNGNERFYPLELVKMKDDDPIYLVQNFPKPSPSVRENLSDNSNKFNDVNDENFYKYW